MNKKIKFNELNKVYLIGEVGINHNGDLKIAKKLIDAANACSWNCVKFQKRCPDVCVPEEQKNKTRETPWGKMSYINYRKQVEFGRKEYDYIDEYCKEKPLDWTASVWDIESLEFILKYDLPFIKIPSAKIADKNLIIAAAKSGIPVVASTGMSTFKDIDILVNILVSYSSDFVLMHTNSSYPTPRDELNISCIKTLKERYHCEVGYSGHEYDLEPTVYACVLGAKIIERHITIDHNMWGTDQFASVEVAGMDLLKKRIKDIGVILGNGEKRITESEKKIRKKLKK